MPLQYSRKPYKGPEEGLDELREKIIGLGEESFRKSYYPELQEKLADLEEYKALLDQSNNAIFLIELPSGKFLDISEAACRQLGYTARDCYAMTLSDLAPGHAEDLNRIFSGDVESLVLEAMLRKGSGDFAPYEMSMRRVAFRGRDYLVVVARDITKRKRAEEAIRKSQAHLTRSQAIAHLGSFEWDLVHGEDEWSDEMYRILGLKPGEVKPSLKTYLRFISPLDREIVKKHAENVSKYHKYTGGYEVRIVRPDGAVRWIRLDGEFVRNKAGEPVRLLGMIMDITERKHAEEELRESEERFRATFEQAAVGLAHVALDGRWIRFNQKLCDITGYTREELSKLTFQDITYPDDLEADLQYQKRLLAGEVRTYSMEKRYVKKNGSLVWVNLTVSLLQKNGNPEYFIAVIDDITGRKLVEERLRLTQFAVDNLTDSSIWMDPEGRIIYVNKTTCRDLGYARDELLSMRIWDIDPNYPYERYVEKWKKLKKEGSIKIESIHVRKDGSSYPVEISVNYLKFEDREYEVSFDRDITERKRAEEALRESEEKFRVLAETSPAAIFMYQGNRLVYANPAGERLSGYTRDEIGKMNFWDMVHPEYRGMVKRYGLERQRGKEVPSRYEVQYITRHGEVRWAEFAAGQIEYRGKPAGIVIAFDITDRKRAEAALIDSKAQADLYLDLMGHDIRNYNQIALGFLELAMDMLVKNKRERELLSKPMDAINSSSRLIDNIMMLKRVTGGKAMKNRFIDLCEILEHVKKSYSHVPGRQVTINYYPIPECGIAANDLVYDIFANLIDNAIKHTDPDKPLTIDIRVKGQTMDGGEYLKVSVEDNGPGISDELKEKLFTRLERGKTKARGLGLYLVKTLAEYFGGRVWVEDRVAGDYRQGARFIVALPAAG